MTLLVKCCNGCLERAEGCHGTCKRYKEEKVVNEEIRKRENMDNTYLWASERQFQESIRRLRRYRK